MTEKNSFIFYHDWAEILKKLPPDEIKNVIFALVEYSKNGVVPTLSPIADIVFTTFKQALDRDAEKWENVCKKNAENGKKGGRPKIAGDNDNKPKKPSGFSKNPKNPAVFLETQQNPAKPKKADNDNDNDNVNVNENIPPLPPKGKASGFDDFWKIYPRKVSKQAALKVWEKLKPNDELIKIILIALQQQMKSAQWQKDGGQFIPYPATWLNGKRWEDDMQSETKPPTPLKDDFDPDNPYKDWR